MATPSLRSAGSVASGTAWFGNGLTKTVAYPASLAADDLLLLHVEYVRGAGAVNTPSGWTLVASRQETNSWNYVFAKLATGSESGTVSVTFVNPRTSGETNATYIMRMFAWQGVDPAGPYESVVTNTGESQGYNAPTVIAGGGSRRGLVFTTINDDGSDPGEFTGETGGNWIQTHKTDISSPGTGGTIVLHQADMSSGGTISGGTGTMLFSRRWINHGLMLVGSEPPTLVDANDSFSFIDDDDDYTEQHVEQTSEASDSLTFSEGTAIADDDPLGNLPENAEGITFAESASVLVEIVDSDSIKVTDAYSTSDKDDQGAQQPIAFTEMSRVTKIPPMPSLGEPGHYDGTVEILYDGIDIVHDVLIDSARFSTAVNGAPGACSFRVRDGGRGHSFVNGRDLQLKINGQIKWTGYVNGVRRGYFLIDARDPSTRVHFYEVMGIDINVLLHRRYLLDKNRPTTVELTEFPAGTQDDVILKRYMDDHLDLSGDRLTKALIEHVSTPTIDTGFSGAAGWAWNDLMAMLVRDTGAIYYIDPERNVVLTDVDTPNAPLGISDAPTTGEVGCRNLEIDADGTKLVNDALVWGAGQGKDQPVFARTTDQPSIDEHNHWQVGQFNPTIWRQATVDRIASSYVHGSPQSKRGGKDDRIAVRCIVFDPSFRVGMKVNVRSAVFGFEDVIPIRSMEIDFIGNKEPRFQLVLSHEIDPPWTTFEYWIPDWALPDFPAPRPVGPVIPEIELPDPPVLPPWCPCCEGGTERLPVAMAALSAHHCSGGATPLKEFRWSYDHGSRYDDTFTYPSGNGGFTYGGAVQGGAMVNGFLATGSMIALPPFPKWTAGPEEMSFSSFQLWVDVLAENREWSDPNYPYCRGTLVLIVRLYNGAGQQVSVSNMGFVDGESYFQLLSGGVSLPLEDWGNAVELRWELRRADPCGPPHNLMVLHDLRFQILGFTECPDPELEDAPDGYMAPANDTARKIFAVFKNGIEMVEGEDYYLCGTYNNYVCPIGAIDPEDEWTVSYEPLGPCGFAEEVDSQPGHSGSEGTPGGTDGEGNQLIYVGETFEPRTTRVWVGGALIRRELDYLEFPTLGAIRILSHIEIGDQPVWISYVATGEYFTPPGVE